MCNLNLTFTSMNDIIYLQQYKHKYSHLHQKTGVSLHPLRRGQNMTSMGGKVFHPVLQKTKKLIINQDDWLLVKKAYCFLKMLVLLWAITINSCMLFLCSCVNILQEMKYIKHSRQRFITFWNTEKKVQNTTRGVWKCDETLSPVFNISSQSN